VDVYEPVQREMFAGEASQQSIALMRVYSIFKEQARGEKI
jgi:hypothetical protein